VRGIGGIGTGIGGRVRGVGGEASFTCVNTACQFHQNACRLNSQCLLRCPTPQISWSIYK